MKRPDLCTGYRSLCTGTFYLRLYFNQFNLCINKIFSSEGYIYSVVTKNVFVSFIWNVSGVFVLNTEPGTTDAQPKVIESDSTDPNRFEISGCHIFHSD